MSQWRTRGYVQDSDEEDEYDSQELHAGPDAKQSNPVGEGNTEHANIHVPHRISQDKYPREREESSEDELAQEDPKTAVRHFVNPSARAFNPPATSQVQSAQGDRGSQTSRTRQDDFDGSTTARNIASSQHRSHTSEEGITRTENGVGTQNRSLALGTPRNASQKLPASGSSSGPVFRANSPAGMADDHDELQDDWPRQSTQGQISSSLPAQEESQPPLAEIPSSPPELRTTFEDSVEDRGQGAQISALPRVSVVIPRMERPASISPEVENMDDVELARIGRALRKRNPIQLHPYLLENEKYRQSLRARGLKPVKVAAQHARQHDQNRGNEGLTTQERDFVVDNTQSSEFQNSSQTPLPSSPPPNILTTVPRDELPVSEEYNDVLSDSDEFPDLSVLIQRKHAGAIQQGAKRRKTGQTSSRKNASSRPEQLRPARRPELHILDIPPSPPPSRTPPVPVEPQVRDRHLRLLPSLSPEQPPTPDLSSSRKPVRRRVVRSDSEDEPPQRRPRRPSHNSAVNLVSSDSENDSDETIKSQFRHLQKRIKGVLPASWLRLDYQAQAEKERQRHQPARRKSVLSRTPSVRTGVTVTSVRSKHRRPASATIDSSGHAEQPRPLDLFSDDSGADMPVAEAPPFVAQEESELDMDFDDNLISQGVFEAPEHDWVDPMLPSGSRNRTNDKPKRKKQTRLTDTLHSRKRMRLDKSEASPRVGLPRASSVTKGSHANNTRNTHSRRSKAPRLSVLDAPVFQTSMSEELPAFLRVAARSVRHRADKGRRSPKLKHIRLQTAADTEDANSVLREWRAGTIRPSAHADVRKPKSNRPEVSDHAGRETIQQLLPGPEKVHEGPREHGVPVDDGGDSLQQRPKKALRQMQLERVQSFTKPGPATDRNQDAQRRKGGHPRTSKQGLKQPDYRNAQLEGLEDDYDRRHRIAAFKKKLSTLNRSFVDNLRNGTTVTNPQLSKFLEDKDEVAPLPVGQGRLEREQEPNHVRADSEREPQAPVLPPRKGRVKRPAQRVDTEAREYRQPSEPLPEYPDEQPIPIEAEQANVDCLEGLGPYGTRYTTDFDVLPLSMGTFFHESTFIGGGELKAALDVKDRDMNIPTKVHVFSLDNKTFRWSAWTDEVASDLSSLWSTVIARHGQHKSPGVEESQEDVSSGVDCLCLLRSVLRYVSVHLHFLDPVDRRSFVLHMSNLLEMASAKLLPDMATPKDSLSGQNAQTIATRATMFLNLVAFQTLQIANNTTIDNTIKNDLELVFKSVTSPLLKSVLNHGMFDLRRYLDDNRRHQIRERGIHEDELAIEIVVVSVHVLELAQVPQFSFWDVAREELLPPVQSSRHVATFERTWYDIFTLLPYLEFDTIGVLRAGRRYQAVQGDWSLGMPLLSRVLKLYSATSQKSGVFVNGYIRSCLCRCHCLVQNWNWKRCEPALTTIFDFFSHRGFNKLQNEDSKGSAKFLQMLNQHPSLVIQPDDRTFHVFLKTLAVGLKALRGVYNEKQIRNVSWRLVPNHRRSYRKEEALHQQDLEGLRNQHDLLCTLYWASPPKSRAGLTFLRNLVDQTGSHREVCRLSVKAWSVLAKFQISTDEGTTALEPFSEWFRDIVSQNLAQYRLARSEAEAQYEAMKFQGHDHITPQQLQMTIKTNQSQILATILDAVVGLKSAISAAHDVEIATAFLQDSAVWDVFKLFDAKSVDVISLMVEVVEVFQAFMLIVQDKENETSGESQQTEDSQDYGEWPDFEDEELIPRQAARPSGPSIDFLQDSLWQLLSTCFGADVPPDDRLLTKSVEAWTRLAGRSVRVGKKEWDNFLDAYGTNSWRQLQDTEQTRKYGPYFMALVMEQNSTGYEQHKQDFLTSWMLCLVERESMLKFQHRFTSALLNADPSHLLLQNLPFLENSRGHVDIKLSEFRERRLSLISMILSNMRDMYDEAMQTGHGDLPGLRRELGHFLKQFMNAMKRNYQEIQQETSVKGSYVAFVQSVVEFLQQYISEIHPIDKFFTDSSVFPLPATDPTYVVGRLKSYAPKLSTPRTLKQLVTFVKTVTERAAFDSQQPYLVSQLHVAVSNTFEHGPTTTLQPLRIPTLRHVLLRAIFSAYITQSISSNGLISSFLFSAPILEATSLLLVDLPMSFSATDPRSCSVTTAMLAVALDAVLAGPLALLTTQPHLLKLPHVLRTVALLLRVAQASVPAATYIALRTRSSQGANLVEKILNIRKCALWISSLILGADEINADIPDLDLDAHVDDAGLVVRLPDGHGDAATEQDEQDRQQREARLLSDIRIFCEREVKESLEGGEWTRVSSSAAVQQGQASLEDDEERQDVYVFMRGGSRREVHVSTCSVAKGKQEVVQAVEALWAVCEACGIAVDAGLDVGFDGDAPQDFDRPTRRARDVVFPGEKDEVVII